MVVPLYGDGGNARDWLHVSDHCRGIQRALRSGKAGEIYHIGGGTELTNKELTARLLEAYTRPPVDWRTVLADFITRIFITSSVTKLQDIFLFKRFQAFSLAKELFLLEKPLFPWTPPEKEPTLS